MLPAGCEHLGRGCGSTDGCAEDATTAAGAADHA